MTAWEQTFDYIVVGAGAAGCIVAARLSEDSAVSVCLIEAGGKGRSPFFIIPSGFVRTLANPAYVWDFRTQPTAMIGDRAIALTQGKVLGGGTAINGMAYVRGQAGDFDSWARAGASGWDYAGVLPYFQKLEGCLRDEERHAAEAGPLDVSDMDWDNPLCQAFVTAANACGLDSNRDYNRGPQAGIAPTQATIARGRRVSARTAYLDKARRRSNLEVVTSATARKLLFAGRRATGVLVETGGAERAIAARREVIVSAGAINTPRLLQLSGLGDEALLRGLGIEPVRHLPGVGRNLQDHYMVRIGVKGRRFSSVNQQSRWPSLPGQVLSWLAGRPSILAMPAAYLHYFMRSDPSQLDADIQGIFTPASSISTGSRALDGFPGFTCGVWQHRPKSRGSVSLVSSRFANLPVVQPNYLDDPSDRDILIAGCKQTARILGRAEMAPYIDQDPRDLALSEDEWLDFARQKGSTVYHPVGTARLGSEDDSQAVVDARLRVHGIDRLRIADASVMPSLPSGNTAAATMMIAEKAADLIRSSS